MASREAASQTWQRAARLDDQVGTRQRRQPHPGHDAQRGLAISRKGPNIGRQKQSQRKSPRQRPGGGFVTDLVRRGQHRRAAHRRKNPPLPARFARTGRFRRAVRRKTARPRPGQAHQQAARHPDPILRGKVRERFDQERIANQARQRAGVGPGVNGEIAPVGLPLVQQRGGAKKGRGQARVREQRGQRPHLRRKPLGADRLRQKRQQSAQRQARENRPGAPRPPPPPASIIGGHHQQLVKQHHPAPDISRAAKFGQQPLARHQFAFKRQKSRRRGDPFRMPATAPAQRAAVEHGSFIHKRRDKPKKPDRIIDALTQTKGE